MWFLFRVCVHATADRKRPPIFYIVYLLPGASGANACTHTQRPIKKAYAQYTEVNYREPYENFWYSYLQVHLTTTLPDCQAKYADFCIIRHISTNLYFTFCAYFPVLETSFVLSAQNGAVHSPVNQGICKSGGSKKLIRPFLFGVMSFLILRWINR